MKNGLLHIDLGKKFIKENFDQLYTAYWAKSFGSTTVQFDLRKLEWIAIEQITFLFGWVKELAQAGIKVIIFMQEHHANSQVFRRRLTAFRHLAVEWKIKNNLPQAEFVFPAQQLAKNYLGVPFDFNTNPFVELPSVPYHGQTFNDTFEQIFLEKLQFFSRHVKQLISSSSDLDYFDNHYLQYSLIKEFYANVCQHAYGQSAKGKAFISIKVNNKIARESDSKEIEKRLEQRYAERPAEERAFFYRNEKPVNDDFIEMCFLDFGAGIVNTLRQTYRRATPTDFADQVHSLHHQQNEDTKILEYAFLLFTSQYELGKQFEVHDYVPRGLYIIRELVRKYNGMIIARSGAGKLVLDFSTGETPDEVVFYGAPSDDVFSGTMITIVLPTKTHSRTSTYKPHAGHEITSLSVESINVLQLRTISSLVSATDEGARKKRIYENFFTNIARRLANKEQQDRLILMDFAGIELRTDELLNKLIYFLAFCPVLSNKNRLCLINMIDEGVNQTVVFNKTTHLKNKGFAPKPIPVIQPSLKITWIGLEDEQTGDQLTQIWKANRPYYELSEHAHKLQGNVINIRPANDRQHEISLTLPDFRDVLPVIKKEIAKFVTAEITNNGIQFAQLQSASVNYNDIQVEKTDHLGNKRAFQTSNGKFQKKYFAFIEKLYVREYRRGLATYLCTFFHIHQYGHDSVERGKVLTVTLSSQLLGKEFVDIFNELNDNVSGGLELIPLSSYYDFDKEEPFEDIGAGDKVIVVNDVISTGKLSYNLYHSLKERRASLLSILTLLDTRLPAELVSKIELPVVALLEVKVEKFDVNPYEPAKPVKINPILNSPTTMSRQKTGIAHILMEPIEFLRYLRTDEMFLVGKFRSNTVYHTYYLITEQLFKLDKLAGFPLVNATFKRLFERLQTTTGEGAPPHSFDFVFYPFFSAVSDLIPHLNGILNNLGYSSRFESLPVPRIMTPKGWRFSFPPKYLELATSSGNKSALIIDDGSCSGDTLMQLIDTISFLDLKEITVLILFARLEDFQREFYTKIQTVEIGERKINLQIFFGTQFHIPVYQKANLPGKSELMQMEQFVQHFTHRSIDIPGFINDYIRDRTTYLTSIQRPAPSVNDPFFKLFGKKEMFLLRDFLGRYDSYRLFLEDEPGSEAPNPINELLALQSDKNKLTLIAVLVHEPQLLKTCASVNPSLIATLEQFLLSAAKSADVKTYDGLYFLLLAIKTICPEKLRIKIIIYQLVDKIDLLISNSVSEEERNKNNQLYGMLSYYLLHNLIIDPSSGNNDAYYATRNLIRGIWIDISQSVHSRKDAGDKGKLLSPPSYHKVFRILYDKIIPELDSQKTNSRIAPFNKIKKYYEKLTLEGINHKYSTDYNNFEKLAEQISGFMNVNSSKDERRLFVQSFKEAYDEVFANVLNDLESVLTKFSNFSKLKEKYQIDPWKNQIDYLKYTLVNNINDTFINNEPARSTLERLKKWFDHFINDVLGPYSAVSTFMLSAKSDIFEVWTESLSDYNAANKEKLDITLENLHHAPIRLLNIHPFVLKQIFMHILINRLNYAPTSTCEYAVFQEARKGSDCVVLLFRQDKPFIKDLDGNRGLSDIRYMLHVYGGEYKHLESNHYAFEIVFPLNVINNE
jgi:hypoxanthine-guanine phosphoribosyltransferase